ncbi:hypothetical protein ACFXP7_11460 [Microbacterium sp. P06]|uniref:hypothetical protein n=1 Tax=unclassified Microbacterium TaxID=2609290 RepID=UPI0037453D8D
MTLVTVSPLTSLPSSSSVHWRQAGADILVATDAGEYAGFVAIMANGYDAHGAIGEDLGRHASVALAQTTVEEARGTNTARRVSPRRLRSLRLIRPLRTLRSGTHGR